MLKASILKSSHMRSPLKSTSIIDSKGSRSKSNLVFNLNLTSLIDAFAILVIFLLMNFSSSQFQEKIKGQVSLPTATQSDQLEEGVVVQLRDGMYFIDDQQMTIQQVLQHFVNQETKTAVIIEADKRIPFEQLSPLISASAQAGFEKFKFVVIPGVDKS
jgi:biopolymer transport protein ExbD